MIGQTISHYRILEKLGEGGMGVVYRARDTQLDRDVALKFLPANALTDEEMRARFTREAKAAAQLNHPNIATIHGLGETEEEQAYIAMELVEGETLSDRIKKGPLKLEDVIKIGCQVADGLQAAHEKGIVHRDIKSSNVMLDPSGRAKIMDFGLAMTAASTRLTKTSETLGTASYMSPEQARAESVDKRTDIWSLGVVLYEMIAGKLPFAGDYEQAAVYGILHEEPEPLTAIRTGVPKELERVVMKCLEKGPAQRYQNVEEVGVDLGANARTVISYSRTTKNRTPRWLGVRRITLSAILAIVLGALSIWILRQWNITPSDPAALPSQPVVVLMDTPAPDGVYDLATLAMSGTNADDLSDVLRDLPIVLHKETLNAHWDREDQILKQRPDLILVHRAAFFHSMVLEFGFGSVPFEDTETEQRAVHLGQIADDKLLAFMGYVGIGSQNAKFLIYSRGRGGTWDEDLRREWVANAENRFPELKGRVWTIRVEGEVGKISFRDPAIAQIVRDQVQTILGDSEWVAD